MWNLVCFIIYSVVPINSLPLTITLHSSEQNSFIVTQNIQSISRHCNWIWPYSNIQRAIALSNYWASVKLVLPNLGYTSNCMCLTDIHFVYTHNSVNVKYRRNPLKTEIWSTTLRQILDPWVQGIQKDGSKGN